MKTIAAILLTLSLVKSTFTTQPVVDGDPNIAESGPIDPNIAESGPIDPNIAESDLVPDENIAESGPIDPNIAESDLVPDENIAESGPIDPNIAESDLVPDENIPESDPPDENIAESDLIPDENIAESDPLDENNPDGDIKKDPYEVIKCSSDPCIISPINSADKKTYIIMTNQYQDCKVECKDKNCQKRYSSLTILSGCNRTKIECDDESGCEGMNINIGDISEISDDLADEVTEDDFKSIKDSATIGCGSLSCKNALIKFLGTFRYGSSIIANGPKALENSDIDCLSTKSSCSVSCKIDDETNENSCLKNSLKCSTRDDKLCRCDDDCDDDDIISISRPVKPAKPDCNNGDKTIKPSAGDTVICTNGCNGCNVDCTKQNCKDVSIYSGATDTNINCAGDDKNCERIKVRAGNLELDDDLPDGYDSNSFNGKKQTFTMDCDNKVSCVEGNIGIIGSYVYAKIKARDTDSFQNGRLKCMKGSYCELVCAFDGCDGSMFDCEDEFNKKSIGCSCIDMNKQPDAADQTNDNYTTPDIEPYYSTIQPDGPTCPEINSGKPSEPGIYRKGVTSGVKTIQNKNGGNKVAGIASLMVLTGVIALLYWVIYKTKLCKKGSKFETDLIKESTYNTFGNNVEMEMA